MSLKISGMFTDGAVLQRERPVKIWGSSDLSEGSVISAAFGSFSAEGKVDGNGKWELLLPAMAADTTPKALKITDGGEEIVVNDILVGDVYFVNGQSNIDYRLCDDFFFEDEKSKISPDDNIRIFIQPSSDLEGLEHSVLLTPQEEPVKPYYKWYKTNADENATRNFSAIGYYCAKKIADSTKGEIPIGLIGTSRGGAQMTHLVPDYINKKFGYTNPESLIAFNIYNVFMHPAENYTTCGMLWYQGESEAHIPPSYLHYKERFFMFLEYLIQKTASGGDYTVYKFQLCSHSTDPSTVTAGWKVAQFRSFQYDMATDPNVPCKIYLIPTHDHGIKTPDTDTAHPKYKMPIAQRCADLMLETRYGAASDCLAPMPCSFDYDEKGVTIKFTNGKLVCRGNELLGFETAKGEVATPAKAEIIAPDTVRVYADSPEGVRYAFYQAVSPSLATLYNESAVPCPTFAHNCGNIPQLTFGKMD